MRALPHKHWVCAVLPLRFPQSLLHAFVVSNSCFACFTSQTTVLCSVFPLAPIKFVTCFSCALVRDVVCVFCLTNTGFVQHYSLGFRRVCCTLAFCFIKLFCVLCLPNIGFVQCFSLQILSSLHAYVLLCIVSQACFRRARL